MVVAALAALASLTSCGSRSNASHLMYISTAQGVYAYRINNASGAFTAVFTAPFLAGNSPAGIIMHPSRKFLYVANEGENTISLFTINPTTATLSEAQPRAQAGFGPALLAMDTAGSTLFVGNVSSNDISTFSVGANGALSLASTTPILSQPTSLVFANNLLFVGVPNFSSVYVYSVSSGNLTQVNGSPFSVSGGIGSLAVDPASKFLFVPNPTASTVSAYTIQYTSGSNTLTLNPALGSPFVVTGTTSSTGNTTTPVAAVIDATATHLYVVNSKTNNVSQFSIGPSGVLATIGSTPAAVGTNPAFIMFDTVGHYVFVGNVGSNSISELKINSDASLSSNGNSISFLRVPPEGIALTK